MPADTLEQVKSVAGRRGGRGQRVRPTARCSTSKGKPIISNGPPTLIVSARPRSSSTRSTTSRAARRRPPTRSRSTAAPPRSTASRSATRSPSPAARPRSSTRSPASPRSATRTTSPARGWCVMTLPEAQRMTGHDGYDSISVADRRRHVAGAAQGGDRSASSGSDFTVRTGKEAGRAAGAGPLRRARLHPHRAAGLRRRRAARRRLPDLQHVHRDGRPAHEGVRAAAHARRLARAGAALGADRDVRVGLLASILGDRSAASLLAPALAALLKAFGIDLGTTGMVLAPRDGHRRPGRRRRRHGGLGLRARAPRHAGRAGRRRCATPSRPASGACARRRIVGSPSLVEALGLAVLLLRRCSAASTRLGAPRRCSASARC